jgi:GDP-L-fucose synthase
MKMLYAYHQQGYQKGFTLLPTNMYGPGDNFDTATSHVIPALIRKLHDAKQYNWENVKCWGDGTASREFIYVGDVARAIVAALENYEGPDPVNIGTGIEMPIKDLFTTLAQVIGVNTKPSWDTRRPNGQPRRQLDVSRAKRVLRFTASTTLEDGLRRTYEWFLQKYTEKKSV